MKLTKNFLLAEFTTSRFYDVESQKMVLEAFEKDKEAQQNIQKLANSLQVLRDHLGKPITINIAYRPLFWEKRQGRNGGSQHVLGKAADIAVQGMTTRQVASEIEKLIASGQMLQGAIGIYPTFVHYDIRKTRVRWSK